VKPLWYGLTQLVLFPLGFVAAISQGGWLYLWLLGELIVMAARLYDSGRQPLFALVPPVLSIVEIFGLVSRIHAPPPDGALGPVLGAFALAFIIYLIAAVVIGTLPRRVRPDPAATR
jgi:hypothetical protein